MHFRCVFTLLQWCVLVGLDWAEPMMFLSLHVTCSCIFHLYVPSFIFIVILIYAGAFLHVSFSLSLSFFRLVALWHQNENPLRPKTLFCSGASSSSDTTPSHVRFSEDKARKDFSKNFSWQGIHSKRQVILSDFSDTDLPTVIYTWGWESLCGISVTCAFVII